MSLDHYDRYCLAHGWKQCLFCKRVLPTKAGGCQPVAVQPNGYCDDCQPFATTLRAQEEK